jgi:hypothetical protein
MKVIALSAQSPGAHERSMTSALALASGISRIIGAHVVGADLEVDAYAEKVRRRCYGLKSGAIPRLLLSSQRPRTSLQDLGMKYFVLTTSASLILNWRRTRTYL